MNVLLVRANPRKTGYTQRILELFRRGLGETTATVVDVDLSEQNLLPCLGCFHCWLVTPGQCVHSDGMSALLEAVLAADVLVCATPIYYYAMSSSLKVFLERTFPLAQDGMVPSARGMMRNQTRYPDRWRGKRLITIVAGALNSLEAFRPANETFQLIADGLNLELTGQLTRPESYLLDYPLSKPKILKQIQTAFVQAGRETGTAGRLSESTMQAASLPLAVDAEHFRTYSNVYWTHARRLGMEGQTPANVCGFVSTDSRVLLREMVRRLDRKAAARVNAVLQFDFVDQSQHFRITVDRGEARLEEATTADPDLRVICDAAFWAQMFMRQVDVREALQSGRLVLQGDRSLFVRMDRLFPRRSG